MAERIRFETENFIKNITVPSITNTYSPVSNSDLIDSLEESLNIKGYNILKKEYVIGARGNEVYGNWILSSAEGGDIFTRKERYEPGDMQLAIGFQNSYDKKLKLKIVPGVRVCICSNQAMSRSNISIFEKKHTGDINLEFPIFIDNSLGELDTMYNNFKDAFDRLSQVQINKKIMSELAGRLYIQEDIISSEQVSILRKEIINPTFAQFSEDNGYNFYQHCTYSIRKSHPNEIIDKYTKVHDFVINSLL